MSYDARLAAQKRITDHLWARFPWFRPEPGFFFYDADETPCQVIGWGTWTRVGSLRLAAEPYSLVIAWKGNDGEYHINSIENTDGYRGQEGACLLPYYHKTITADNLLPLGFVPGYDLSGIDPEIVSRASQASKAWPKGMRNLDSRRENQEILSRYVLDYLYSFDGHPTYFLYKVDPEKNTHMPSDFRPHEPFYVVLFHN